MRFVDPPSLGSPRRGQPGDGLDRLLSDFFRSEMPAPWPEPKLPDEQPNLTLAPRPAARGWALFRSRFALAASVALLLGALSLLSGKFQDVVTPGAASGQHTASPDPDAPRRPRVKMREQMFIDPETGQTKFRIDVREQLKGELP